MVIVGYTAGSGDVSEETVETQEMWCRTRKWYDRYYYSGCAWSDEFYYYGYCCWYETVTETVITGDVATWKVQNSWGTDWGDGGYIYYAVEGG